MRGAAKASLLQPSLAGVAAAFCRIALGGSRPALHSGDDGEHTAEDVEAVAMGSSDGAFDAQHLQQQSGPTSADLVAMVVSIRGKNAPELLLLAEISLATSNSNLISATKMVEKAAVSASSRSRCPLERWVLTAWAAALQLAITFTKSTWCGINGPRSENLLNNDVLRFLLWQRSGRDSLWHSFLPVPWIVRYWHLQSSWQQVNAPKLWLATKKTIKQLSKAHA